MQKEIESINPICIPSSQEVVYSYPSTPSPEPLHVPSNMEVASYSLDVQRRTELEAYLYNIGEEKRFKELLPELDKTPETYEREGYNKKQRIWMKFKRDEGLDLAPYPHLTDEKRELHHINPVGWLQGFLHLQNHPELINHPHNGITLSRMSHVGPYIPNVNHSRHPDVNTAQLLYAKNPNSFKDTFSQHWDMAKQGIRYWIHTEDSDMFKIATDRTNRMRELQHERK